MLIASSTIAPPCEPSFAPPIAWETVAAVLPAMPPRGNVAGEVRCVGDSDDDEEDLGDEEDLSTPDADVDEESAFDDFDDEFDDDFEEEENDPDWDHPEDTESDEPPPAKGPGKKK